MTLRFPKRLELIWFAGQLALPLLPYRLEPCLIIFFPPKVSHLLAAPPPQSSSVREIRTTIPSYLEIMNDCRHAAYHVRDWIPITRQSTVALLRARPSAALFVGFKKASP